MKTVMKRKILLVIAAVLVLSLSVGFASAYFSDHEAAQGAATIKLGGQTDIEEKWDDGIKDVSILNTGETEMVVRVIFYGPDSENAKMSVHVPENSKYWVKHGDYYYYKAVLQPKKQTPFGELTAEVIFKEGTEADLGENYDIVVMQEAAQATYEYVDGKNKVAIPDGWDWIPTMYSAEGGE
ncbi:MAG: hypothetical protein IJH05_04980 [Firmicutes bacterium]|nr:hypothetical protein [Bacillota bacterium]